jgi:hypothetical protein
MARRYQCTNPLDHASSHELAKFLRQYRRGVRSRCGSGVLAERPASGPGQVDNNSGVDTRTCGSSGSGRHKERQRFGDGLACLRQQLPNVAIPMGRRRCAESGMKGCGEHQSPRA